MGENLINRFDFFDENFKSDQNKMNVFSNVVDQIQTNTNIPHKSAKASVAFVMYSLIKHDVITTDNVDQELSKYLTHIYNNFNQYRNNLGKHTLSYSFFKFSCNYLLENYYEQIYKIREIQSES